MSAVAPAIRPCAGCGDPLGPKHLRTQIAPPDSRWSEVRTHNLACLLDFLEEEEEKDGAGRLFTKREWIADPS